MLHQPGSGLTTQLQEFSIHTYWKTSYKGLQNEPVPSRSRPPRHGQRKKTSYKHRTNLVLRGSVFPGLHHTALHCRGKAQQRAHSILAGSFILQINSWELRNAQIWELSGLFRNFSSLLFNSTSHASFWKVSDEVAVFRRSKKKLYPHFGPVY